MVDVITSVLMSYLDLSAPAGRGMSWTAMELHVMVSGKCYVCTTKQYVTSLSKLLLYVHCNDT